MTGGESNWAVQILVLVAFIVLMYVLLIRPQKKKEKSVQEMRDALRTGDEIVTIGGICGKIVKTKEDSLIIQVGADKTKFEVMRWSVSSVVSKGKGSDKDRASDVDDVDEQVSRKSAPRRLRKAQDKKEEAAQDVKEKADEAVAEVENASDDAKKAAEEIEEMKEDLSEASDNAEEIIDKPSES